MLLIRILSIRYENCLRMWIVCFERNLQSTSGIERASKHKVYCKRIDYWCLALALCWFKCKQQTKHSLNFFSQHFVDSNLLFETINSKQTNADANRSLSIEIDWCICVSNVFSLHHVYIRMRQMGGRRAVQRKRNPFFLPAHTNICSSEFKSIWESIRLELHEMTSSLMLLIQRNVIPVYISVVSTPPSLPSIILSISLILPMLCANWWLHVMTNSRWKMRRMGAAGWQCNCKPRQRAHCTHFFNHLIFVSQQCDGALQFSIHHFLYLTANNRPQQQWQQTYSIWFAFPVILPIRQSTCAGRVRDFSWEIFAIFFGTCTALSTLCRHIRVGLVDFVPFDLQLLRSMCIVHTFSSVWVRSCFFVRLALASCRRSSFVSDRTCFFSCQEFSLNRKRAQNDL